MPAEKDAFSVEQINHIQDLIKLNKEMLGFYDQLTKFEMALKELESIEKDVKDKRITKVFMPSLGNMQVQINPNSKKFKKWSEERKRQFTNSIEGIKGQIRHRQDYMNESAMWIFRTLGGYLLEHDLDLPIKKLEERKKQLEEEKKVK